MSRLHTLAFKTRNPLAGAPLIYALLSTRWEWRYAAGIWPLAAILCIAGACLRGWARCHCNFARRKKKVLATSGPYAFSRNPLYVGNTLVLAGAGVASGLVWFLPILVLWAFSVYNLAIKHEERVLVQRYGEAYHAYRSRVPAWISLSRLSGRDLSAPDFLRVASLQTTYALLVLVPFLVKEINPLSVWARP